MSHPNKIRLIAELEENSINQYTPFSDQSENMIHLSGNVEGFELCQLFDRIQCTHCMRHSMRGVTNCECGPCIIPLERVRRLNKERFEVLTIPLFTIKKRNTPRVLLWSLPSQIGFKKKQRRRNSRPSTIDSEIKNHIANRRWLLAGRKKPWTPCSGGPLICCVAC